jgi:hypothetical protein
VPVLRAVVRYARQQGLSARALGVGALRLTLDLEEAVGALLAEGKRLPPCAWRQAFPERDQDDLEAHEQYCPLCAAWRHSAVEATRILAWRGWQGLARAVGVGVERIPDLRRLVQWLPDSEFKVIVERYGLGGDPPKTLLEIARGCGWRTRQFYASRLHRRAIRRLRDWLVGEDRAVPVLEADEGGGVVVRRLAPTAPEGNPQEDPPAGDAAGGDAPSTS